MARVQRTDISTLRPVERREDGTIIVDAHLTRCGVFPYYQVSPEGEISVRRELRLPEEVFAPEALRSFEGRPVTNNHPPDMLDAKNARQYAVGAAIGMPVRDDDHVRGRLSIYDADTVAQCEAGKTQVSNGYTCDTIEQPGVHPLYGPYDAIQKNIRGNHIAVVERGRAGITAAIRMDRADGLMVVDGMPIALPRDQVAGKQKSCQTPAMARKPAVARVELIVKTDEASPDPDDEASRNARGENDAPKAKKRQPGAAAPQVEDRSGDIVRGSEDDDPPEGNDADRGDKGSSAVDPDDDEGDDEEMDEDPEMGGQVDGDAYDRSYGADGELTVEARNKMRAASFAMPDKGKLPIHDKPHVRAAMSRFGQTEFGSAEEKHAAFNRIKSRAKSFGVSTSGFEKAHAGKLDHKDTAMINAEQKAAEKAAKKAAREAAFAAEKQRADAAQAEIAELKKQLTSKEAELENARRAAKKDAEPSAPRTDEAQARLDEMLDVLDRARQTGAKVDSKMSKVEIMRAAVKHVDGEDVPAAKKDDASYVEALFDGACKRAKKDAADTVAGANALAQIREASPVNPANTVKNDADDTDEEAAKKRMRGDSLAAWQTPSKKSAAARN